VQEVPASSAGNAGDDFFLLNCKVRRVQAFGKLCFLVGESAIASSHSHPIHFALQASQSSAPNDRDALQLDALKKVAREFARAAPPQPFNNPKCCCLQSINGISVPPQIAASHPTHSLHPCRSPEHHADAVVSLPVLRRHPDRS
jgi:hypothetical protein